MRKNIKFFKKTLSILILFGFIFQQAGFAQVAGQVNIAGFMQGIGLQPAADKFRPLHMRYFSYDTATDEFSLLLDKGDTQKEPEQALQDKSEELLKYFLIGITLPDSAFWVNLRPDGIQQIIDPELSKTDVGKVFLEADLQLKKDTARLTSPETPEGREYWDKLYKKAGEIFGTENITIPTLTRPWIVPGEIIIRETEGSAFVYKANLKVMLEQDHLKDSAVYNFKDERLKQLNEYSSQVIRETILPKLTREVNLSKKYAPLRQVFYSLILARWFKARFSGKPGVYPEMIDRRNLSGLTSKEAWSVEPYFNAYKKSFNDGEYNVKEPVLTPTGQVIRSYFSGGIDVGPNTLRASSPGASEGMSSFRVSREGPLFVPAGTLPFAAVFRGDAKHNEYGHRLTHEEIRRKNKDDMPVNLRRLPYLMPQPEVTATAASPVAANVQGVAEFIAGKLKIQQPFILSPQQLKDLVTESGLDQDLFCELLAKAAASNQYNFTIIPDYSDGALNNLGIKIETIELPKYVGIDVVKQANEELAHDRIKTILLTSLLYHVEASAESEPTEAVVSSPVPMTKSQKELLDLLNSSMGQNTRGVINLEDLAKNMTGDLANEESLKYNAQLCRDLSKIATNPNNDLYVATSQEPSNKDVILQRTYFKTQENLVAGIKGEPAMVEPYRLALENALRQKLGLEPEVSAEQQPAPVPKAEALSISKFQAGAWYNIFGEDGVLKVMGVTIDDLAAFFAHIDVTMPAWNVGREGGTKFRIMDAKYVQDLKRAYVKQGEAARKQTHLAALRQMETVLRNAGKVSSPLPVETPGGIDFRAMNLIIQPMGSLAGLNFRLPNSPELARMDLDREEAELSKMVEAGIIPSGERLKEYLAVCHYRNETDERMEGFISCLIQACRLEEEQVVESTPEFKEALVIADSGKFSLN